MTRDRSHGRPAHAEPLRTHAPRSRVHRGLGLSTAFAAGMALSQLECRGLEFCRLNPDCDGGIGAHCEADDDCDTGFCCTSPRCGTGMCTYRCNAEHPCPPGIVCEGDICFFRCVKDRDCAEGQFCHATRKTCEWP